MPIEGDLRAENFKVAIVAARFNEFIVSKLQQGAAHTLHRHGLQESNLTTLWVPGAFEIPLAALTLAQKNQYHAVICLGAVIKGSTPHFDYVCSEVAKGISHVNMSTQTPCIFGILTTNTIEQAIERAGTKAGNKGSEAALAAIEMASLMQKLRTEGPNN